MSEARNRDQGQHNAPAESRGAGPAPRKTAEELARILIDNRLISEAQAQLALADQQVSGMTFEEVLLARRWIDENTLDRLAPWRKSPARGQDDEALAPAGDDYQENLKRYRRLMEKVLGTGWD